MTATRVPLIPSWEPFAVVGARTPRKIVTTITYVRWTLALAEHAKTYPTRVPIQILAPQTRALPSAGVSLPPLTAVSRRTFVSSAAASMVRARPPHSSAKQTPARPHPALPPKDVSYIPHAAATATHVPLILVTRLLDVPTPLFLVMTVTHVPPILVILVRDALTW